MKMNMSPSKKSDLLVLRLFKYLLRIFLRTKPRKMSASKNLLVIAFPRSSLKIFKRALIFLIIEILAYKPEEIFGDIPQSKNSLFSELTLLESVNQKIKEDLPLFYNYSFVGGYFNMPSARMPKTGEIALGWAYAPPYRVYGVNFQMFDHVELSGNYRVFHGILEKNFGHEGFGDDAERIGNIKLALLLPEDGFPILPNISIGAEDFIGTKRFHAKYVVITKKWLDANVELSMGWGKGRIKGLFGGLGWSPFRQSNYRFLQNLGFLAEYDAVNYKKHKHEHPKGREVKFRINAGLSYLAWDTLQISISSLRGKKIAASASLRYPIGNSKGFLPKIDDPITYCSPIDTEPLGSLRSEQELSQELAYAFSDQGLDLYTVYLTYDTEGKKVLWLKVVNNRYREEQVVRDRIQHLLSALAPSDIASISVVVEADALPCQSYRYRTEDLRRYRLGLIGGFELETLAPMREAISSPSEYESSLIFKRRKEIWTFSLWPRLLSFFGSSKGKYKYNLGVVISPEGYLFDEIYYKLQLSYSIKSSMANLGSHDRLNPSQLVQVRSDTLKYFQTNTASIEQVFLQKGWNIGKGFFYRLALGYFEPAYGGVASEFLYYPVKSCWAVGLEGATLRKRRYEGIALAHKIRKLKGTHLTHVPFLGVQYFLNIHYDYKPLNLEFKISAGQFLAKDKGVRTEVTRYFRSGLRFTLWYTVTNGHDIVNGKTYHDKGFAFILPFDIFLKQSSRNYIGYGMSVWLRDVGAQADTGRTLYRTLNDERYNY
jgi:hypothetical protein